jgi:L-tyrosine isonitrile synthase
MSLEAIVQIPPNTNTAILAAFQALLALSNHGEAANEIEKAPVMRKIVKKMKLHQPLRFLLPAFPAKSPNPQKTSGIYPDLGEVIGLVKLNNMCEKISQVYPPGAEVIICSDGRVFSDVVMVSDQDIDRYSEGINEIIREFDLRYLSTFAMESIYRELLGPELRQRLIWQYAKPIEEIRHLVINDPEFRTLFNGIHRFMLEDQIGLEINSGLSKNQISKKTKSLTYELIRRSDAWSTLLMNHFEDSLRLSIHPYPIDHEKFGVRLLSARERWATPWHNVTVQIGNEFELMTKKLALKLGATEHSFRGKYAYYKL